MSEADPATEPPLAAWASKPVWVPWARIEIKSRPTKCPARVLGQKVVPRSVEKLRTTLGQAEELVAEFPANMRGGVGLALGVNCHTGVTVIAIDLDVARDPVTGNYTPWALEILGRFAGAFTEASPSGGGIHIVMAITAADYSAIKTRLGDKQRVEWKRPGEALGAKAPGFELLLGGFVTVTFNLLPSSAPTFGAAPLDALRWLIEEAGPAFVKGTITTPKTSEDIARPCAGSRAAALPPNAPPQHTCEAATVPEPPAPHSKRFIASASRMQLLARKMDDASYQVAAALAAVAEKSDPGRSRAALDRERLCALPGRDRGSTRSSRTITVTFRRLVESFDFKVIGKPVRPHDDKPGLATVWAFPAWWMKTAAPRDEQPPAVRMPRTTWQRAVWSLSPFALRLWSYLIATHQLERRDHAAAFTPSSSELAQTFGCKPERVTSALDEIAAAELFEVVEAKRPGRAGSYQRATHA